MTSGIFLRSFFDIGKWEVLLLMLIGGACLGVWRMKALGFHTPLFISGIALLACALGIFRFDGVDRTPSLLAERVGEKVTIEGLVTQEPDMRARVQHLSVEDGETHERVLVTADRFLDIAYGDYVSVEGILKKPESFETDLGRTFNYEGYLKARGVKYIISYGDITVLRHGEGNAVLSKLYQAKQVFMRVIEAHIPEPEAGLSEGLLLGVKRALGEDLEQIFREVGIIHIVVLSGYNIMLVVEAVTRLLAYVAFLRTRLVVGVCAIITFAFLVGLSATVVRASVMAVLVLIARATGRTYAIMRALVFAGVGMLIINPYLLAFDPGFQLSFLATLGLIVCAPLIDARLSRVPSAFGIREFLTATLATQLFVLPLLLYSMGMFSVVSVLANVLVLPMVPFAMLFTFLTGMCGLIVPVLGTIAGFAAYLTLTYIVKIAEVLGTAPFAAFTVPAFPFWVVLVSYGVLICVLVKLSRPSDSNLVGIEESHEEKKLSIYADWTIEEETENPRETRSVSRGFGNFK